MFWILLTATIVGVTANTLILLLIPESPTWHSARNEHDKTNKIYTKIAKINGSEFGELILVKDFDQRNISNHVLNSSSNNTRTIALISLMYF